MQRVPRSSQRRLPRSTHLSGPTKGETRILGIQPAKKELSEILCDLVHSFLDKSRIAIKRLGIRPKALS